MNPAGWWSPVRLLESCEALRGLRILLCFSWSIGFYVVFGVAAGATEGPRSYLRGPNGPAWFGLLVCQIVDFLCGIPLSQLAKDKVVHACPGDERKVGAIALCSGLAAMARVRF